MSRVINTANPGKIRNQERRTIAEILRHLMTKPELDDESKDMLAAVVIALRNIADTIETTTTAWEKRNYFMKADRFRLEWEWTQPAARRLERIIRDEAWQDLPAELATLVPRFADIHIARMTRDAATWRGAYRELIDGE